MMTPAQLRKTLARLYGPGATYHLAKGISADMGVSLRSATYWLDGQRPVPPYMPLIIEALEARKLQTA